MDTSGASLQDVGYVHLATGLSTGAKTTLGHATVDGGLGFELGKCDFPLGLAYNQQVSEHRTGHEVFGSLRYEF